VAQQVGQISPSTPGQCRRARFFSQILQGVFTGRQKAAKKLDCSFAAAPLSYHRYMTRTDLYLKVELDHDDKERPERIAQEICRMIRRIYGVRQVEVQNLLEKE
jgi:hypothetical protein